MRFIENHDEPRAAAVFGPEQARAAAVVMSTVPGARLYHDGQLSGRRDEDPGVPRARAGRAARRGPARVLRLAAAARGQLSGDRGGCWTASAPLVSWAWDDDVVVVNLSDSPAGGLEPWGYKLPFG